MGWAVALVGLLLVFINPYVGLAVFALGAFFIVAQQVDNGLISLLKGLGALVVFILFIVMFMMGLSVFFGVMGGL